MDNATPDPFDNLISASIRDACRLSGFSRDAMYGLINAGSIKSFLMGSRRFIDAASLRAYIARRTEEPLRRGRLPIVRRDDREFEDDRAGRPKPSGRPTAKARKRGGSEVRTSAPKGKRMTAREASRC
jgi:hypothetical protein